MRDTRSGGQTAAWRTPLYQQVRELGQGRIRIWEEGKCGGIWGGNVIALYLFLRKLSVMKRICW